MDGPKIPAPLRVVCSTQRADIEQISGVGTGNVGAEDQPADSQAPDPSVRHAAGQFPAIGRARTQKSSACHLIVCHGVTFYYMPTRKQEQRGGGDTLGANRVRAPRVGLSPVARLREIGSMNAMRWKNGDVLPGKLLESKSNQIRPVGASDRVYLPDRNGACLLYQRGPANAGCQPTRRYVLRIACDRRQGALPVTDRT